MIKSRLAKVLLIAGALGFAGAANAMPATSVINITVPGGGTIAPKTIYKLPLSQLIAGADYTITCHIGVTNATKGQSPYIQIQDTVPYMSGSAVTKINNKTLHPSIMQSALKSGTNTFYLSPFQGENDGAGAIGFENLDNSAIFTLSDCMATPAV